MGWTYTQKHPGESVKDFFKREFDYEKEDGRYGKIIDCAIVNLRTAYIAYETNASGKKEVVALVCLLHFVPNARDGFNFGFKDMDETCGPNECDCSERILKLLTPTADFSTGQAPWVLGVSDVWFLLIVHPKALESGTRHRGNTRRTSGPPATLASVFSP